MKKLNLLSLLAFSLILPLRAHSFDHPHREGDYLDFDFGISMKTLCLRSLYHETQARDFFRYYIFSSDSDSFRDSRKKLPFSYYYFRDTCLHETGKRLDIIRTLHLSASGDKRREYISRSLPSSYIIENFKDSEDRAENKMFSCAILDKSIDGTTLIEFFKKYEDDSDEWSNDDKEMIKIMEDHIIKFPITDYKSECPQRVILPPSRKRL